MSVYNDTLLPSHGQNFDMQRDSRFFVNGLPQTQRRKLTEKQKNAILHKLSTKMNDLFQNFDTFEDIRGSDTIDKSPFPIDAVFTWVQNTPEHENRRQEYSLQCKGGKKPTDNNNNRYNDNNELKYADYLKSWLPGWHSHRNKESAPMYNNSKYKV